MGSAIHKGFFAVWATSIFYGLLVVPIDFLFSIESNSIGFVPAILLAFRSCGLITLIVAPFTATVFILLRIVGWAKSELFEVSLEQAILVGSGAFVTLFFWLFDRFFNKYEALVVMALIAMVVAGICCPILKSWNRSQRLGTIGPKASAIGTLAVVILFGVSYVGIGHSRTVRNVDHGASKSDRPNILLIVMDTVRADHLSLYGYDVNTTPFLERMAEESAVFNNAFSASPWTLPSHASLFTGLYPSQHNAHGEHLWLDDSFRTLAEILRDNGYQTTSFSNNDYVSSYHNLVQGFERSWYKGHWTDDITMLNSVGASVVSTLSWFWNRIENDFLAKIVKNPASIWDYPNASLTNKAVSEWLDHGRDESRPFFIFINYMDAHLPYNPDDETARPFFDEEELRISYKQKLRFPPIEYCLDMSKGKYTEADIRIITTLYDACIRYLDGQLKSLASNLISLGIYDETLIIITSDHGEYLGTRNRLAHGLGLHEELLHVPLISRYPPLFEAGARCDIPISLVDIPETILSFARINERPKGMPETQLLFEPKDSSRPNVFGEFRFPLHLLVTASLREDNSIWFVEQKTIRSQTHQLIWKSRGEPEFYNVADDPLEENNIFSGDNPKAKKMNQQLLTWFRSLYRIRTNPRDVADISEKERLELIERLRAIGYTN